MNRHFKFLTACIISIFLFANIQAQTPDTSSSNAQKRLIQQLIAQGKDTVGMAKEISDLKHHLDAILASLNKKQHKKYIEEEVGLQANYFLYQFAKSKVDSNANPYSLAYNLYLMPYNVGVRLGVGYNYSNSNNDLVDAAKISVNSSFNLRAGLEKRFKLSRHLSAYAGADWVYFIGKSSLSSYNDIQTTTTTANTTNMGGGPVGGLEYSIGRHIRLLTESSFYYTSGKTENATNYSVSNTNDISYTVKTQSAIWSAPDVIYCFVTF